MIIMKKGNNLVDLQLHTLHEHIYFCRTEFLFWIGIIKNHILCLQFYATNNWKDFPQTSLFFLLNLVFPPQFMYFWCWHQRTHSFVTTLWPCFVVNHHRG